MKIIRTYNELRKFKTFKDRFNYLKLDGCVGLSTFGADRYLNQILYHSSRWKRVRDIVIIRDKGCDLGVDGFPIYDELRIHHMNPIMVEDIEMEKDEIFDPEYLITTCLRTHNAIHYGDESQLPQDPIVRRPFDTCPWKS